MKLKICMLLSSFHYRKSMQVSPEIGICSYLTNFGHEIVWVIWGRSSDTVQAGSFNNVQMHVTQRTQYFPNSFIFTRILNKVLDAPRRFYSTLQLFKEGQYNLIFTRENIVDGLVAAYIKRRYKVHLVLQLCNPLEQEWEIFKIEQRKPKLLYYLIARFNRFIITRLLHNADLVIPISEWLKEHLVIQGISESKVMAVPEGVETKIYLGISGKDICNKYQLHKSRVIVYVGTLGKARYLSVLIQAFSETKRKRGNMKLLIVGEGSDEENLKILTTKLKIRNDVIFTGWVPQEEALGFISAADIGISPIPPSSFYKLSSPIKILEYLAMAKPVVANKEIPEHRKVLEESGGGILVPFTPEAFANAIIKLLDNPQEAAEMGDKGREWVVKNRSYEILARQVEKGYFKLLEKR
ncbi:glycosyltransferase family 4 protein [Chloroflexota bacterium]